MRLCSRQKPARLSGWASKQLWADAVSTTRRRAVKLGMDTFSLRWQGWDAFQFLDYAARLGLDNVHFSERGFLASLDKNYLQALKQRANELRLTIEIGMTSFDRYSRHFNPALGSGEQQLIDMAQAAQHV